MNFTHFAALFKARCTEFIKDRESFLWNLMFPLILVFGFAFAFSGSNQTVFKVGVIGQSETADSFSKIAQISYVKYPENPADSVEAGRAKAFKRLEQQQLDFLVDYTNHTYYVNDLSANGQLVRRIFVGEEGAEGSGADVPQGASATASPTTVQVPAATSSSLNGFTEKTTTGKAVRYVDKLVPGVIGMNIMFSCLFGVGYVIVRYRKNGVLKRLKATPVSAATFISAQAISRLAISVVTSVVVYTATNAFLGFTMNGNYLLLFLLTVLASLCMISLGLVFAARMKSEELANGLMNLVTFPMLLGSGVFFSLDGTPQILQTASKALPLTHFIEGARAIMLDGAGVVEILPNILFLSILTVVFFLIAAFTFKWE